MTLSKLGSGIARKVGAAALGALALTGAAATALPAKAEAQDLAPGVQVEQVHWRGHGHWRHGGISPGDAFAWGLFGGLLTNPCVWGGCVPPPVIIQPPPLYQYPYQYQFRGPLHWDSFNGWHNHDSYSHPFGW